MGRSEDSLSSVSVLDQATSTFDGGAIYTYYTDSGTESEGLLAQIQYPGQANRIHTWTYPSSSPATITFSSNGQTLSQHQLDSAGHVTVESDPDEALTCSLAQGQCGGDFSATWCVDAGVRQVSYGSAMLGDGTDGGSSFTRTYLAESTTITAQVQPHQFIDSCSGGPSVCGSVSQGTERWEWALLASTDGGSGGASNKAVLDKRGNWVAQSLALPGGGPSQEVEVTALYRGAVDYDGGFALESTYFGYDYGLNEQQRLDYQDKPSVLQSGRNTRTRRNYEQTTDRLVSIIQDGWTQVGSSTSGTWSTVERDIGTFFFTAPSCGTGSGTPDPLGRTLEVHGPCITSGLTATDCAVDGGPLPMTQFAYYGASGNGNANNRLQRVRRFTNSAGLSCGSANHLDVTFNGYDALGNPTSVTDEAGISTTFTYEDHRPLSRTVALLDGGTATWQYTYDNEKLSAITYPTAVKTPSNGLVEVFCHRSGTAPTSGACTGGSWNERLQWKAKYSSTTQSTTTWTEAVLYAYWGDGTLASETFLRNDGSSSGETRSVKRYGADAHQRPTFEAWGDGVNPGGFGATRGFDGADNLSGVGLPFNNPPAWCLSSGAPSQACALLTSNRANRLSVVDEFPTGGTGADIRTCIDHDAQGNITQVCPGENGASQACAGIDGGTSSCGSSTLTYTSDDFGNMVRATLPWLGSGSIGALNQEFDAFGNVIRKQTPQMATNGEELTFTFDPLSRLAAAGHIYNNYASTETLYSLTYDGAIPPSTNCPSATNTGGRLSLVNDNFGLTWLSYDELGDLIQEIRLRSPDTQCFQTNADSPHTRYTYNVNGALTSVIMPLYSGTSTNESTKRTVTYVLDGTDRPSSVNVAIYNGTSWQTLNPLTNALWEPYGGLRGYQINTTDGGTAAVEYALGDNGSSAPSGCPSFPSKANSDHTGRLRGLWVSKGNFSAGSGAGDVYKREYTWTADQVARTDTCVLGSTTDRTETFTYDAMLRLTGATGSSPSTVGGNFASRSFGYDARSNLNAFSDDSKTFTVSNGTSPQVDQPLSIISSLSAYLGWQVRTDNDGRVTREFTAATDSSGGPAWEVDPAYGPSIQTNTDSIMKAVTISGATYNYWIDAKGRRRQKTYPLGATDEYFHGMSNQLLADRGNDSVSSPSNKPEEDYVWLGGRPVIVIRGQFNSSWTRKSDWTTNCTRNADGSSCGMYFPVTDNIGKPVVVLDWARRIVGTGDYDPYGTLNRVNLDAETAHPYSFGSVITITTASQALVSSSLTVKLRAIFPMVDTYNDTSGHNCGGNKVLLKDPNNGNATLWTGPTGAHLGRIVSSWVQPAQSSTPAKAAVDLDASKQCSWNGTACHCVTTGNSGVDKGVVAESFEYEAFQAGATPYALSLRFPGQYYDPESDLTENWNRYYSPFWTRYLQPEPLLAKGPGVIQMNALKGHDTPAYAYALNNPMAFTDRDAKCPLCLAIALGLVIVSEQNDGPGGSLAPLGAVPFAAIDFLLASPLFSSALGGGGACKAADWLSRVGNTDGEILTQAAEQSPGGTFQNDLAALAQVISERFGAGGQIFQIMTQWGPAYVGGSGVGVVDVGGVTYVIQTGQGIAPTLLGPLH